MLIKKIDLLLVYPVFKLIFDIPMQFIEILYETVKIWYHNFLLILNSTKYDLSHVSIIAGGCHKI